MKNFTVATAAVAGLSAAVLGLAAPAIAAPTAGDSAQQTISQLEAQGNRVIVHRESGAALSDASVVSIRTGAEVRDWVTVNGSGPSDNDRVLQTTGRVFFVDVK